MTKIVIEFEIKDCRECPKCTHERTEGAGYALDYICSVNNQMIAGYIEHQMPAVPEWCPFRLDK